MKMENICRGEMTEHMSIDTVHLLVIRFYVRPILTAP
jgi:hypothetical protein